MRQQQERIAQLEVENEDLQLQKDCKICCRGAADGITVDMALMPCGHITCGECAYKINNCHVCRAQIRGRQRLFF